MWIAWDFEFDVLIICGGHPEGDSTIWDKGAGGEFEDVIDHRFKTIWFLRSDESLHAAGPKLGSVCEFKDRIQKRKDYPYE